MGSTRPSLLIRVRNRADTDAWREFFELYSPMLYTYARNRELGHDDAEEIQASCYETIVKHIMEFSHEAHNTGFRAWLRTMVNRRVIDLFRKKKMQNAQSSDLEELQSQKESATELWERNWRTHHLMYCVAQVGKRVQPETFEAFRLLTEEGLGTAEVCAKMGMNADQVYKIKSRMLELIRHEMKDFDLE